MPTDLIIFIAFGIVLCYVLAQVISLRVDSKHIEFHCEVDMKLTEPDEVFSLVYWVENTGFWPLLFSSISFVPNKNLELREDEAWIKAHAAGDSLFNAVRFRVSLMPHRSIRGRVHLSASQRGLYTLGRVYVETGDFFGFSSRVRTFDIPHKLVCTARVLPNQPAIEPFGGFLGDVSARRFILEDPSLVVGYRDYTGSEPMKRISWNQTARTGQLMVKNHDFTVDADVAILVDVEECPVPVAECCLAMIRTVCDRLEAAQVSYALISNGDLTEIKKGVGRKHNYEIQRRIGLSHFVRFRYFEELAAQCAVGELLPRGWVVIAPRANQTVHSAVRRLEAVTGGRVCVLIGEEATENA